MVGALPNSTEQLAAHSVLFNSAVVFMVCAKGVTSAAASSVGRSVGASRNHEIPMTIGLLLTLSTVLSGFASGLLWVLRAQIAKLFTSDTEVQHDVKASMLGACLVIPAHALLMCFYGVSVGAGKQKWPSIGTVAGYCVGLPLAYCFGFVWRWPRALTGVWMGCVIALTLAATWAGVVVYRINWSLLLPVEERHVCEDHKNRSVSQHYEPLNPANE